MEQVSSGWGLEGWESNLPLPHQLCESGAAENVPGREAVALQRVPLPGPGWGEPHSASFGCTG